MFKKLIEYFLYPVSLLSSVMIALSMQNMGIDSIWIVMALPVFFGALFLILEWVSPEYLSWYPSTQTALTDLLHSVITNPLPSAIAKGFFLGFIINQSAFLQKLFSLNVWPSDIPIGFQLMISVVLADGVFYFFHRSFHTIPFFWKWHAIHHTVEQMYTLASARNNPIPVFVIYGSELLLLTFLGAPEQLMVIHAVYKTVHGMIQHANIKMSFGPLNWILSTPERHRWHHNRVIKISDHNYGNTTAIWDHVFRSNYLPKNDRPNDNMGLPLGVEVKNNFFAHWAAPFHWKKVIATQKPSE